LDTFPVGSAGLSNPSSTVWAEVHKKLLYLHGQGRLSQRSNPAIALVNVEMGQLEDLVHFLGECNDNHFLDFIEYVCAANDFRRHANEEEFVGAINKFFRVDDLPYTLTPFLREERKEQHLGDERTVHALIAKPKVIRRDSQVTHEMAIEPALQLLADQRLTSANQEFMEALEDYRHGDYGDCVTKCNSAMESVMKIICDRRGWSYDPKDSANTLKQIIISESGLDGFFDPLIGIIATLRNRLSSAHGAGTQQRSVPEHLARYAINVTASNILLLIDECL